MCDDQRIDAVLRNGVTIALLGNIDALRFGPDIVEDAIIDQAIMNDDIRLSQRFNRTYRQKAGIARPCAYEDDASALIRIE